MVPPLWKTVWLFLIKLNVVLVGGPAVTVLGMYPKELKTYIHTESTQMFLAALFVIALYP